jgi:hypothetical protein
LVCPKFDYWKHRLGQSFDAYARSGVAAASLLGWRLRSVGSGKNLGKALLSQCHSPSIGKLTTKLRARGVVVSPRLLRATRLPCVRRGQMAGAANPGKAARFMKSCGFYIGDVPGRVSINDDAINYP